MKQHKMRPLIFLFGLFVFTAGVRAADFGVGEWDVRGGVIFPSSFDSGLTAGVSLNVGEIVDGLYLVPALNYFQAERDFGFVTLDLTGFSAGAEVRYFLDQDLSGFYFGGGPYFSNFSYSGATRSLRPGAPGSVALSGVAGFRWGSWLTEARYTSLSGFNTAQLLVGLAF